MEGAARSTQVAHTQLFIEQLVAADEPCAKIFTEVTAGCSGSQHTLVVILAARGFDLRGLS